MSVTRPGEGTTLSVKISSSFVVIGGLAKVASPSVVVAEIETTNLSSSKHDYRASRLPDYGQVKFMVRWDMDDSTHQAMRTGQVAGTIFDWKIIYVDDMTTPANSTFSGFITEWSGDDIEPESNVEAEITIRLTTIVTNTAGSS